MISCVDHLEVDRANTGLVQGLLEYQGHMQVLEGLSKYHRNHELLVDSPESQRLLGVVHRLRLNSPLEALDKLVLLLARIEILFRALRTGSTVNRFNLSGP